jgi:hypothetical protein
MRRFDWRRFESQDARDRDREQLDRDQAHWPRFDSVDLLRRYPRFDERRQPINGHDAWAEFVPQLLEMPDLFPPPEELTRRRFAIVDQFFAAVANPSPRPKTPCMFVSHQRLDTHRGERVACLVDDHGLDSWLDAHDPTLMRVNALASDPLRSILIALIVELALLNSTHVIALHTTHSIASRWIPYELARAKARGLTSLQAAGWFEAGQTPKTCGDYVQLAVMTHNEPQVIDWIRLEPRARPVHVPAHCTTHDTDELT